MDKIWNLQALRAVAAGAVLTGHVLAEAQHHFAVPIPLTDLPWSRGVDLFFVISGLIIGLMLIRPTQSPGAFLLRRLWRVVPLYYVFTTLMVGVVLLSPSALKDTGFDPGQIVSSYLFVPYARDDGRIAPVLSLGWTLNYEVFFYALASAALWLRRPFVTLSLVLIGLVLCHRFVPHVVWAHSWTDPIILEFLAGLWLARAYQTGWWMKVRTGTFLAVLGVGLLCALHHSGLPRWIAAGLPATLITGAFALSSPFRWPQWMLLLGEASYALYLSHRFVLRPLTLVLVPMLAPAPWAITLFVCIAVSAACLVAVMVHLWFERPLLQWRPCTAPKRVTS